MVVLLQFQYVEFGGRPPPSWICPEVDIHNLEASGDPPTQSGICGWIIHDLAKFCHWFFISFSVFLYRPTQTQRGVDRTKPYWKRHRTLMAA